MIRKRKRISMTPLKRGYLTKKRKTSSMSWKLLSLEQLYMTFLSIPRLVYLLELRAFMNHLINLPKKMLGLLLRLVNLLELRAFMNPLMNLPKEMLGLLLNRMMLCKAHHKQNNKILSKKMLGFLINNMMLHKKNDGRWSDFFCHGRSLFYFHTCTRVSAGLMICYQIQFIRLLYFSFFSVENFVVTFLSCL